MYFLIFYESGQEKFGMMEGAASNKKTGEIIFVIDSNSGLTLVGFGYG